MPSARHSELRPKPRFGRSLDFVESEVPIYDNADRIRAHHSQDPTNAGPQTQTRPPGRRAPFRSAALVLGALSVLTAAALIVLSVLYVSVQLDRGRVGTNWTQRQDNITYSRSEKELKHITDLEANNRRLQEEVKQLKVRTKECGGGWTRFGCSCYFTSSNRRTWPDARRECESKASDLVVITSREEQDFLTGLINDMFWIGLRATQNQAAFKWEWVDESPLTERFWTTGLSEPTEPSVAACCDPKGAFTQTRYGGADERRYVCEK